MALAVKFDIDKSQLTAFEEFMTDDLQAETEMAYARTLNRLGRGCVNTLKRKLGKSEDEDDQEIFKAGISWSPQKIKRIAQLNPIRMYVGAGSSRKRYYIQSALVGQKFKITLHRKGYGDVTFLAQRNRNTKHVDADTASSPRRIAGTNIVYKSNQQFLGYRNTALPITVLGSNLNNRQKIKFGSMVEAYIKANHDKIFEQEFKKAVEKTAKKKR